MEKGNIWLAGKCGKMRGGEMLKKTVSVTIRQKVCKGEVKGEVYVNKYVC
jgi:prepilin signal peptidase PulO-like enzyme (type II secretory pathway)